MESIRRLCATTLNVTELHGNCFPSVSSIDEAKSNEPRPRRMDYAQSSSPSLVQDQVRIDGNVTVIRQLYANLSLSKKNRGIGFTFPRNLFFVNYFKGGTFETAIRSSFCISIGAKMTMKRMMEELFFSQ